MAKRTILGHTKVRRLCRKLECREFEAVGILEMLWHLTAKECPRGDIGRLSNEDIAIFIDYPKDEDALIAALVDSGWIDEHPEFRLVIHDWADHADDSVHTRLYRQVQPFCDGQYPKDRSISGGEKPKLKEKWDEFLANGGRYETVRIEENTSRNGQTDGVIPVGNQYKGDSEGLNTGSQPSCLSLSLSQGLSQSQSKDAEKLVDDRLSFDDAWAKYQKIYPRRTGENSMARAEKALKKLYLASQDLGEILEGVERYAEYVRRKPVEPGFVISALNFLDRKLWLESHDLPEPEPDHRDIDRPMNGRVKPSREEQKAFWAKWRSEDPLPWWCDGCPDGDAVMRERVNRRP